MSSPSRCGATQHRQIIIAIGILALSAHPAAAQTKYIGTNGGAWNGLGNWSLGMPDASSPTTFDAWIDNGNTPNLAIPTASVRRLRVGVLSSGGLEIDNNGVLNVTQDFHVNEGAPNTSIVVVKNGGDLISPSTVVGFSGAGDAHFTITGAGSTVSGGQFIVGYQAAGTLSLSNGGSLNTSGAPLYIAAQGGAGLVRIGAGLPAGTITASQVQFGTGPGTLQFDHTGAHTFSTPINGPGNIAKIGAGETTLTGTNAYTGATTIAGGKLVVGADANLGVGANNGDQLFIAGGTLRATSSFTLSATRLIEITSAGGGIEVDAGRTLTYPGNLAVNSGGPPATFTKSGGGILEVTGSLRVSAENLSKIIVNQGELRSGPLGLGDNSTKGAIEVHNGAVLRTGAAILGDNGPSTIGGEGYATITGVGSSWLATSITLARPRSKGTITIADGGAVSINGGAGPLTLVTAGIGSEGILNIGNGGAPGFLFASAINTDASTVLGTVNFNHAGSLNFSVPIQGGARVNKLGTGTTTLLGTHVYNKPTTVIAGTLVVAGSLTSSAPIVNGGGLIVNGSVPGAVTVNTGGALGGTGTVGAVNVAAGGSLAPGASAGTLTTGTLVLASGSFSRFELAAPGIQGGGVNDLVMVNGNLDFGGTLVITELPGFSAGQYTLFKYTSIAVNQGFAFEPAFLAAHPGSTVVNDVANQRVVANITGPAFLPGDFNENGVVDGADLTAWRNGFGDPPPNSHTQGDADADGDVDGADFLTWQRQVGTLPATAAAASVPEPTSLALVAAAVSVCANRRRRILSMAPKS